MNNLDKYSSKYVAMKDVIGEAALDYSIPILHFDDFITLAQRALQVYNLANYAKRITFAEICEYTTIFIKTPFGKRMLDELNAKTVIGE